MTETATPPAGGERTLFGHPRPLFLLFTTEAWERFGYYGMRALLTIYLLRHFLFDQDEAAVIYGAYTSLVYLTPLIGGYLADKYLGSRNAVKLGALLMAIGYFGLTAQGPTARDFIHIGNASYAVETVFDAQDEATSVLVDGSGQRHTIGTDGAGGLTFANPNGEIPAVVKAGAYEKSTARDPLFFSLNMLSLAIIIIGNGFFKPNISTMVGDLYSAEDRRRDAGFTIFYMGINLGAFFGQVVLPEVRAHFGFNLPFLLAAIGMLISLGVQVASDRPLRAYGNPPHPEGLKRRVLGLPIGWLIGLASLVAVAPVWWLMTNDPHIGGAIMSVAPDALKAFLSKAPVVNALLLSVYALGFGAVFLYSLIALKGAERGKMIVAVILCLVSALFWALFEGAGTSLTFFADSNIDRHVPFTNWVMPPEQVQFFNAVMIIVLAPIFSAIWIGLGKMKLEPPTPVKFALGLIFVGGANLALIFGTQFHDAAYLIGLQWMALLYLLQTIGELCLSPVGLSMVTRLSVPRLVGMMMGLWFLATSLGLFAAGLIASAMSTETFGGRVVDPAASMRAFVTVGGKVGWTAVGVGVVLLLATPLLVRLMRDAKPTAAAPANVTEIP
ncbi:MAG TPA: peptide MFS transporter [Caulobacterales bacterium]|nr:peptide MFS transporter [Caulobacterales bacterium]